MREMFRKTGQSPAKLMAMTVAEFQYIFPTGYAKQTAEEKSVRIAKAHASKNHERGLKRMPPLWSDEFHKLVSSKLDRVNHGQPTGQ